MIGYELGGRYEILARIGGGGMALVYKAHDMLLGRKVAVKVLRQQFVHDEEFIRRFRREAQSAASLSHPNVVNIYDVGQEDDTHYIVMEYIDGQNLNEVIMARAPLQTDEAVRIATQICDALEHAHQHQIIHRDIKPHNILIGTNGRVKVTDFGIARAATASSITQTGSVVGSVHYFSPEHAKGVNAGEKSDLYSLGIVLYQMLTGHLPFLAESPISVALKHLQDAFEEPRKVNPHIPQSVENVVLRAMRKNPDERYASATEMLRDLETCLEPGRLHEPKLMYSTAEDPEATRVMPVLRPSMSSAATEAAESDSSDEKSKKKWVKPVLAIGLTLLVIGLMFWGLQAVLGHLDTEEVDVPYVVGMTEAEARAVLEEAMLKVEEPVIYEVQDDIEKDVVFEQSKQNMRVKQGSYIQLYVSLGPELELMPSYEGELFTDVRNKLLALGVAESSISTEEQFSEQSVGTIIAQTPAAGTEFNPDEVQIAFVVSKGRETFAMPNLVGLTEKEAIQAIATAELTLGPGSGIVKEPSYAPTGQVIEQFPYNEGDPVAKGEAITITVSSGLPEEAIRYTFNISISPARAGESSDIRIVYSDARGENTTCCERTINDTRTFPVEVVLAPNTEAMVTVYRDGRFADTFSKTYDEARSGNASATESVPGTAPPEPESPPAEEEPPVEETSAPDESGAEGSGNSGNEDDDDE